LSAIFNSEHESWYCLLKLSFSFTSGQPAAHYINSCQPAAVPADCITADKCVRPDGCKADPAVTTRSRFKPVASSEAAAAVGTTKADAAEAADDAAAAAVGATRTTTTTTTDSTTELSVNTKEPNDWSESTSKLANAASAKYSRSSHFSYAS
jgi:hypothetical protein